MTVTYVVSCNGHAVRRSTTGNVVNDTPSHLTIHPDGANFNVRIPRRNITKVEVAN